jgi:MFS family permease
MLYMPVVKLFYSENDLNNFDLFLLHAIYSAVIFLVEIPSGYLSDAIGRKKAIIIGLSFGLLGFSVYSFSFGFWGFLLAELALGIGEGFISGSDSALLYDSLLESGKQKQYVKYEGRISGAGNMAEAFAGVAVTLVAFATMRYYYYIQTIFAGFALTASWFLTEPRIHGAFGEVNWNSIVSVVKNTLWRDKELSRLIIFSSLIGFSSLAMAWFAQIFLFDAGVPDRLFGIVWTTLNAMVAAGSFSSHWMNQHFGNKRALVYILIFISAGYFIASATISPVGIIFLMVFYFVRGNAHPILKNMINAITESKLRATVLSIRSLLIRSMFALLGPLMGVITEKLSLSYALLLCGFIILFPGSILVYAMIRRNN